MISLASFLSYVFVTTFTPGPNNIMAMSNAHQFGFRKTVKFLFGVFAGFFAVMILSSYFNILLFGIIPKVRFVMGIIGAVYMLYLALKIFQSQSKINVHKDSESNSFFAGFTMQFFNPKVILYGITVISNFVIPFYKSYLAFILFSIFLAFVGFLATSCWALFGTLLKQFLAKYRTLFNLLMILLLIYSAISISGLVN